jgi:hypothetical protein
MEIPPVVRSQFLVPGWRFPRCVRVDPRVPSEHPAHEILAELGGLHIGKIGPGIECATSHLRFAFCDADEDYGLCWSGLLASKLIAFAETGNGHGWLFVDEGGRVFGGSQAHDAFYFEGDNFAVAAERLLLGRRARPMLKPDQEEIYIYGEKYTRGHPEVFEH